jgi:metal-dependent amidase/aminoacylase/carboxypeptidase family protein
LDARLKATWKKYAVLLHHAAEPAYQENHTRAIWEQFCAEFDLPLAFYMDGKVPVIQLGNPEQADFHLAFTADLDAVWDVSTEKYAHLCGHDVQSLHAFQLAYHYQTGRFPEGMALTIMGSPGEECLPAMLGQVNPFLPGKKQMLEAGLFHHIDMVLSTHVADHLPTRTFLDVRQVDGLLWFAIVTEHRDPVMRDTVSQVCSNIFHASLLSLTFNDLSCQVKIRHVPHFNDDFACKQLQIDLARSGIEVKILAYYPPYTQSETLRKFFHQTVKESGHTLITSPRLPGYTDLGYPAKRLPVMQLHVGGTTNQTHATHFEVTDPDFTYFAPIEVIILMLHKRRGH